MHGDDIYNDVVHDMQRMFSSGALHKKGVPSEEEVGKFILYTHTHSNHHMPTNCDLHTTAIIQP